MKTPANLTLVPEKWYRCPDCDAIIEDQERRCPDCNKFGAAVLVYLICPHCEEPITEDDV